MASLSSKMVVVAVAVMVGMAAMSVMLSGAECPSDGVVYPCCSPWWSPAMYGQDDGVYEFQDPTTGERLAPEYDESNNTYYMRLAADVGAKYRVILWGSLTSGIPVSQAQNLAFINAETGRYLGWRNEGSADDLTFLVESTTAAQLTLDKAEDASTSVACPLAPEARCEAYYIKGFFTARPVIASVEDGVTYFKRAPSTTSAGFPFLLLRSTYPSVDLATSNSNSVLAARA